MKNSNLLNRLLSYSHEKQTPQRFGRYAVMLIMLLTLGVGQMWADSEGDFYNMYLSYTFEGTGGAVDGNDNNTGVSVDAGTLTSGSLILTGIYLKCWDNWGNSNYWSCGGQLCYTNKGGSTQYVNSGFSRSSKNGNNFEYQNSNPGLTIASYDQASGSFAFESWGQTWGCDGHNWGDRYFPKSSGHYTINYKIAPPAVSGFTITPSGDGYVSGSGTSDDPYIMKHDAGNLVLTISGSKAHTDANSSAQYYNGSSWSATATKTINYATGSTTKKSITLKMKYTNSTASLDGAVSEKTVYYQRESTNTVSASASPAVGGSVTPSSSTTTGQKSGIAITATKNTGYNFSGWSIVSGSGSFVSSTSTASNRFKPTSNTSLRATFTAKNYTVKLDKNSGDSNGTVQTTYNSNSTSSFTGATRAGYSCDGYFTAKTSGTKILNSDGTLVSATVSNYLSSGYWVGDTVTVLYAQWTEDVTNYTVTYGVKSDQTSLGTLSCAKTSGGAAVSSGDEVASGTGVTFTAAPITGYEVDAWCSDAACSKPIAGAGYANTYATSVTADLGVYVKFKKKIYTITYSPSSAPTGCTYTTKPTTGTYGNTVTMVITPSTGYTVSVSARDASSNVVTISNPSANTYTFTQPASAVTVTVTASQIMSTLTTSNHYDAGNPSYSVPSKSASSIGIATTSNLTATTPGTGYRFVGWTLSDNIVVTSGDEDTDLSITVRSNGNGVAATAQANYEEVLTSTWHIIGEPNTIIPNGWTANDDNMLRKASGSSTSSTGSLTINVKTLPANNSDYQFKVYNDNTDTPYGWSDNDYYWVNKTCSTGVYADDDHPLYFIPNALGEYVFSVNWGGSDPSLTVTFPTAYQVNFGQGSGTAGSASATYSSTSFSSGTKVQNGKSITLTAPSASTGYTWDGWYNASSGGTRVSTANPYDATISSSNRNFYARYTINNHSITHNAASHGDYTIKVGTASAVNTNTTSDYGKTITLTASPASGYHFTTWSVAKSPSGTVTPSPNATTSPATFSMPDNDVTISATFAANNYTITLNNHEATSAGTESVSVTYDATTGLTSDITPPAKTGYTFGGYYTAEGGSGTQLITAAGKWQKNNSWINSSGQWINAGNLELHAKWTANSYTVSFDKNGGTTTPSPSSKSVTYDAAYGTLPGGMTHLSKTFVGWYTDPDDGEGTLITAETIVSTADDHTLYAHYENVYSVNVNFKSGDATIYPATSVNASPTSLTPTITAPEIFGYTFVNWTGSNATFGDASSATTTVNATAATTVTANYNVVPTIYFKNNLGWDSVFVTFDCGFNSSKENVPSNKDKPYYRMTQIGSTDVFYCVIPDSYKDSWTGNIAFDNTNYGKTGSTTHVGTWDAFFGGECIGRGDFDQKTTLYIPYSGETQSLNSTKYYPTGCWMKYNSTESGYQVNMNKWVTGSNADTLCVKLTAANAGGYEFSAKLNLKHPNYTYGFKLYKIYESNETDLWYSNCPATITAATDDLPWHFWSGTSVTATSDRCGLHTEALGDYTITVSFATGRPEVNVEYPASVGDWRLAYNDRVAWSGDAHDASWYIYSRVIKAKADAEDIVSFYVSKAEGANAHVELQKCTAISVGGVETWTKQGDNLDLSSITGTGIYNFKVTQNGSKVATAAYLGSYSGDFYIRTDASDGGWNNYISSGKNLMTYSEYAKDNSGFTHYFMRFVTTGSNIKFCIANDYSPCLTEYCISDSYTNEYIEADGNVRFMWDQRTNEVSRAYISGSSVVSDRFLVLEGSAKMFDENGNALSISGLNANEMNFGDDQNWIYEATIKAQPKAKALLTAKYNNKVQYFGGSGPLITDSVLLIDGSGTDKYKMRIVYDFKTNRLIKAFIPDGTINTNLSINADLMIIREHQGEAQQISFGVGGALDNVKTVYGAMKFNKYTVNGKEKDGGHAATGASRYERDLFYISFPFDVKLSDAFGFGTYGQHWILEYYDGKGRAANGFWVDSDPNWKFVMPSQRSSFTMKAFEGYILALDLDEMTESASIWDNGVEDVYVYFPSSAEVDDIQATNRLISIDQDGYECTINRATPDGNRTIKDSYWHCIGVPSFANYSSTLYDVEGGTAIDWSDDDGTIDWSTPSLPYLYTIDWSDKSLDVTTSATFSFKATYSYMVQYAGATIYWSAVNVTPSSIVARQSSAPKNAEFRIELQKDGQKADQTFVRLTEDENVTTGFDFNYDLSKEFNKNKANLYTLVTTVKDGDASVTQSAANVLPMTEQTTVIPVGVKIAADGDYTFAIPDGTEGIGVTLIDNETGIHTSLSALDYTINLNAGTYDNRFVIEISPISQISTDIENTEYRAQDTDVRKVLINGILYIVRDNKMYDAQGHQVK